MTLTYKVRLEPNNKQVGKFRQFAGAARYAYNWALEQQDKNHKITNTRNDYLHKVTTDIVKREPSFIVLEDLNISGMLKNKHLSKYVQQQNFYKFRELLTYKAERAGIKLILADRFYPSSKMCSNCGAVKPDLHLKDRTFICNECGLEIDRDLNASLNLCRLGTVSSTGINVCGVSNQTKVATAKSDTVKQKANRSLSRRRLPRI